jgi:hypothetical protein
MKLQLGLPLIAVIVSLAFVEARGSCGDTYSPRIPPEIDSKSCSSSDYTSITKTTRWIVYWLDGYQRSVDVTDHGETTPNIASFGSCTECWPAFATPYWWDDGTTAYWYQPTSRRSLGLGCVPARAVAAIANAGKQKPADFKEQLRVLLKQGEPRLMPQN